MFEAYSVIEILDLARDLRLEIVEFQTFDRSDPRSALFQAVPEIGHGLTNRRYCSHNGNDHTGGGVSVCHSKNFRFLGRHSAE